MPNYLDYLEEKADEYDILITKLQYKIVFAKNQLACLIPDPIHPKLEDWPCENGADREILQLTYENLIEV